MVRETPITVRVYDYNLVAGNSSVTIAAGQSATFPVTLTSAPDPFPQPITFFCSGLPQLSSCTFSPSQLPAGTSSASVQVTIHTTAVTVSRRSTPKGKIPGLALGIGMLAVGLVVTGGGPGRRRLSWFVLLLAAGLTSCGGNAGNSLAPPIPQPGTPSGNYTVTIQGSTTGSIGAAARNTQVTLIVQ